MRAERITSSTHTNRAAIITNRPSAATTNDVCPEKALASVRTLRTSLALSPPPRSTACDNSSHSSNSLVVTAMEVTIPSTASGRSRTMRATSPVGSPARTPWMIPTNKKPTSSTAAIPSTVRYGPPVPLNQSLLRSTLVVSSRRVSTRPTNHATASVIQPTMPWTTWSQTNPPPALTAPPTVLSNTQPSPSPSQPITGLAGRQRNQSAPPPTRSGWPV